MKRNGARDTGQSGDPAGNEDLCPYVQDTPVTPLQWRDGGCYAMVMYCMDRVVKRSTQIKTTPETTDKHATTCMRTGSGEQRATLSFQRRQSGEARAQTLGLRTLKRRQFPDHHNPNPERMKLLLPNNSVYIYIYIYIYVCRLLNSLFGRFQAPVTEVW